ncbi:thermotolerance protein [Ophiostoma piceae UAMH 11346]|uniref:Thermotolerance protein n=1 Tax=Ophiostoma piceae (strain UAMH 11346) TaxID=1262450 RepID=S3BVI4_OPHP1|nr:thermotolerance protein [Ophiostoma piceae UAMH 11346]
MAFQTNVLRDGEWVTETVDLHSVLNGNAAASSRKPQRQAVGKAGTYGILTKTAIESPVAQFILPVRLRSSKHVDVAFIGDHYVQIRELGRDSQLRDVIRKTDFGSRIVNAKVVGIPPESTTENDKDGNNNDIKVKMEEDGAHHNGHGHTPHDVEMEDTHTATTAPPLPPPRLQRVQRSTRRRLPPQQLVVILENGDQIFLFLESMPSGQLEFHTTQYQELGRHILPPGRHAAVDPSSRYMALACDNGLFEVYELESPRNLNQSYVSGNQLRYIRFKRPRPVHGTIHKMEFLYPRPDDDYHIILLLIVIHKGEARMVIYEWEAGDDLRFVLGVEKYGQLLPASSEKPLLIVPLTFNSAFFTVSGGHIWFCPNSLHQPAEFTDFRLNEGQVPPSLNGEGDHSWSAWARPYRLPTYNATNDSIYLARQNGSVVYLELNSDNLITLCLEVGELNSEISSSFCTLFDHFSDILIVGGHSGPGTVNQLRPRLPTVHLGIIPNWASVADFVTTDERSRAPGAYTAPDRMFAASVYGATGAITEFRSGLRACAGLDFDAGETIRRTWIFPVRNVDYDPSFHILVSFVDSSLALHLSADLAQVSSLGGSEEEDGSDIGSADNNTAQLYDLGSRTVAAALFSVDVVIQVTENNLVFAAASGSVFHSHAHTFGRPVTIVDACISGALVAISTHAQSDAANIHLLRIGLHGSVTVVKSFVQSGESTCLHLSSFGNVPAIVAGIVHEGNKPSIAVYSINESERAANTETAPLLIDLSPSEMGQLSLLTSSTGGGVAPPLEPLSSIAMLPRQGRAAAIAFGTRAGQVGTIVLDDSGRPASAHVDTIGLATVHIAVVSDRVLGKCVLATCDGRLCLQSNFDWHRARFRSMKNVWVVVDAPDNRKPSPFIASTTVVQGSLPGREGRTPLVFSSGSRVMLAELESQSEPAHRTMPLGGTPHKVIYSHSLNCLVVAVKNKRSRTTLQFIDPDTGDDISLPVDSHGAPIEYVRGLGEKDDQILGLAEWVIERDGNQWVKFLVSTLRGRFLVLSVKRSESGRDNDGASVPASAKIKYWTRHKKHRADAPVYSVVCEDNNVFSCVGSTIKWDKLDLVAKRLDSHGEYGLPSPATSLRIVNGKLVALTIRDSVLIIDFKGGNAVAGEMTLHHASSNETRARHMIDVYPEGAATSAEALPILMLSLGPTLLSGVWVPWRMIGRDCSTVFEADLPSENLRRLARGRTRPGWQQARRGGQYGTLPSTATTEAADILGACEDGSLQHFTLLGPAIWRVMRYIQNYAERSAVLYPYTYDEATVTNGNGAGDGQDVEAADMLEDLVPDNQTGMHIDGDMLQRCLDGRALEQLFSAPEPAARLFGLLDALDNGRWTSSFKPQSAGLEGTPTVTLLEQKRREYFALMYDILEYYLEPVF